MRRLSVRARWALVVALCCVTLLAGWWSKARCLDGEGWTGGEQYLGWCYSDVYALWWAERLDVGATPYVDHPVEYPVLTGAQMWLAAQVVEVLPPDARPEAFFHVTAAMGAAALLGALVALRRAGVPPARLAWYAGLPTLAVYAFMNWDAAAVLALALAVLAHLHGRDGLAGVAAGLGTAAKLFPGFLVPIVVAARLAQRRPRAAAVHAGAAAGVWLAVNVPVLLVAPSGWRRFLELNRQRPADWDSLYYLAEQVRGARFDVGLLNAASAALFVTGAVAIVALGARRRRPDQWWQLLLPIACWFLLTNKVYSPQFSIWLLPLFALALPSAAPLGAFAVADLMVWVTRFPFLGGRQDLAPAPGYDVYAWTIVARAIVLLWIIVLSVHQPARPAAGQMTGPWPVAAASRASPSTLRARAGAGARRAAGLQQVIVRFRFRLRARPG